MDQRLRLGTGFAIAAGIDHRNQFADRDCRA